MPVNLWVVVWVVVVILSSTIIAHNTRYNPYLDPTAYDDSRLGLRHRIPIGQTEKTTELSNDLAIQIKGGKQKAIKLARSYGLEYLGQVFEEPAVFHLRKQHENRSKRDKLEWETKELEVVHTIASDPEVEWVEQQLAHVREKRNIVNLNEEKQALYKRKNIYSQITANRLGSRRSLKEVLRRPLKTFYGKEVFSTENGMQVDKYLKDDLEIDSAIEVEKRQYPLSGSPRDGLIRVPLSRSFGYGFKPVQMNIHNHNKNKKDNFNSINSATLGDRSLRNDIPIMEIQERKAASMKLPSNTDQGDSFGLWLDHLGEPLKDFNDPLYDDQWYLRNTGQLGREGYDLNVTWAWLNGYTGRGVVLSVLDDGLQTTNPDIAGNYAPDISYSLIKGTSKPDDPSPRIDKSFSNSHGTYCAGIMSAVSNNSVCGVGVAYDSKVGAVRLVDGKVTDLQEATALSRHMDKVDVFSASWGPTDDGTKLEGPAKLAQLALTKGVTKGRGGKGSIYVWASGNGGVLGDNCNMDGYTSSIYTLSVGALTDLGTSTYYGEPCASTLAAVYVGGTHTLQAAKDRKKRHMKSLKVVVPELDGHCSEEFQGTSAAAPLMAGVVALVLHANGNLTWRDMQHIVVKTSQPTPEALTEPGWQINGGGKRFHLKQGFGAVNAGKMVETALQWKNVKPQKIIIVPMFYGHRTFNPLTWMNVSLMVDLSEVPSSQRITEVEHVKADITLVHPSRKLLTIFIVSPSGTASQVLTHRRLDENKDGFKSWGFMSVHFWGEKPEGSWKVAIKDDSGEKGFLKKIDLTIFGS